MGLDSVDGKVAIVTGGGSGIGLAFTKLIHSKGCSVVIGDLKLTPDADAFMKSASGPKIIFKVTDVTKWRSLKGLFQYTIDNLGAPDLVCPGAGIFEPVWSNFWNDSEPDERNGYATIDVNITHPVKATRLAVRSMVQARKGGVICHISSIGGQTQRLSTPVYCATKAFVNHFVRGMSGLEERLGIKVIAVAPGLVNSPLWHESNKEKLKSVGANDLWIQPSEIAEVLLEASLNPKWAAGTIVEASGQGRTRSVEVFNDAGPPGIGHTAGANMELEEDVFRLLEKEAKESKL